MSRDEAAGGGTVMLPRPRGRLTRARGGAYTALREWGAGAELTWLPDLGIEGNGHFMFFEENSDELVEVLVDQLVAVGAPRR